MIDIINYKKNYNLKMQVIYIAIIILFLLIIVIIILTSINNNNIHVTKWEFGDSRDNWEDEYDDF